MADIPQEALTAAAVAIHDVDCPDTHCGGAALGHAYRLANAALAAAGPVIRDQAAAAERERIRHLARAKQAVCGGRSGDPDLLRPFADLIGDSGE